MAKTELVDYSQRRGKMNKKDKVVFRVRNGKQQSYIPSDNTTPPSKAQTAHRSLFGKVNSLVNAIMADPKQEAEWDQKRLEYNRSVALDPTRKRYQTTRKYAYDVIKAQITQTAAAKRRKRTIKLALPKGLKLHNKSFAELTTTELYEILKARFIVFYMEQHCYYQDMDDIDYISTHLALHRKGRVVAYARLYKGTDFDTLHLGRMLTVERGNGYGKYILEQALEEARRQGASAVIIHAQTQAVPFYEKAGFKSFGPVFMEADIPHIQMKKILS